MAWRSGPASLMVWTAMLFGRLVCRGLEFPSMRTGILRGDWNDCVRQGRKALAQSSVNLSALNRPSPEARPFCQTVGIMIKLKT